MTDHTEALQQATEAYRREIERAKNIRREADDVQREASDQLGAVMRAAFAAGMKKAEIIRAAGHVWSRTWVDRAISQGDTAAKAKASRRSPGKASAPVGE